MTKMIVTIVFSILMIILRNQQFLFSLPNLTFNLFNSVQYNSQNKMIRDTQRKIFKVFKIKNSQHPISLKKRTSYYFSQAQRKLRQNSYQVLGITEKATEQQIKQAYLLAVKKYHPDLTEQADSTQKFQQIQQAYDSISSPQKRAQYNRVNIISKNWSTSSTTEKTTKSYNSQLNEQQKERMKKFEEKYRKNFSRKEGIPDQYQFSYKFYKQNYEKIRQKKVNDYIRYPGQAGYQYYVHKDQKPESHMKPILGGIAIVSVFAAAIWYVLR